MLEEVYSHAVTLTLIV